MRYYPRRDGSDICFYQDENYLFYRLNGDVAGTLQASLDLIDIGLTGVEKGECMWVGKDALIKIMSSIRERAGLIIKKEKIK